MNVFLASEKAVVRLDPARVQLSAIRAAVSQAGYQAPELEPPTTGPVDQRGLPEHFTRRLLTLMAVVFGTVLFVIVVGEWFAKNTQTRDHLPKMATAPATYSAFSKVEAGDAVTMFTGSLAQSTQSSGEPGTPALQLCSRQTPMPHTLQTPTAD